MKLSFLFSIGFVVISTTLAKDNQNLKRRMSKLSKFQMSDECKYINRITCENGHIVRM
ncbi:hypothetical protein PIROE2DRAFT_18241 [Piromyces sp. E2]|nr:hypothetical protein PIROE2DRAFT_18241 [Piromyces sp. E2]|eukprot:OUM56938.1 hypothetical protein PIROE2DRAFT_18241 [Piromyces sp. E2]